MTTAIYALSIFLLMFALWINRKSSALAKKISERPKTAGESNSSEATLRNDVAKALQDNLIQEQLIELLISAIARPSTNIEEKKENRVERAPNSNVLRRIK